MPDHLPNKPVRRHMRPSTGHHYWAQWRSPQIVPRTGAAHGGGAAKPYIANPYLGYAVKLAIALTALVIAARPATAQPPQSPLEAWINDPFHTTEGRIRLTGQRHNTYHRGYRCPDFQVANFVIATLEKSHLHEKTAKGQRAILLRVLAHQGCQPALRGDYLPLELGTMTSIDGGFEASEDWTALRVKAPDGAEIGLVYDASIYAMD